MRRSLRLDQAIPSDEPRFVNVKGIDSPSAGGDDAGQIVGPEEKAANTRGQLLTGKIRLDQYLLLVESGCDGGVVMHWTEHRADKEIRKRRLCSRATPPVRVATPAALVACEICGAMVAQRNRGRHMRRVHKST
jgi:hypothetical protein